MKRKKKKFRDFGSKYPFPFDPRLLTPGDIVLVFDGHSFYEAQGGNLELADVADVMRLCEIVYEEESYLRFDDEEPARAEKVEEKKSEKVEALTFNQSKYLAVETSCRSS